MVLTMHGFSNGGYILLLGFLSLLASMAFWFRDVAAEGIVFLIGIVLRIYNIYIAKAIPREDVEQALIKYKENINSFRLYINNNNFGYYLAGLLEGGGHISLPALGNTILNRVINPRIVFTSHINNLGFTNSKFSLKKKYSTLVASRNQFTKEIRPNNFIPQHQYSIFIALLLSNGWAYTHHKINTMTNKIKTTLC